MPLPSKQWLDSLDALNGAPRVSHPYGGTAHPRIERTFFAQKGQESLQPATLTDYAGSVLIQLTELTRDNLRVKLYVRYDTLPGPVSDSDFYDNQRGPVQRREQLIARSAGPGYSEAGSLTLVAGVVTKTDYIPSDEFTVTKVVETWTEPGPAIISKSFDEFGQLETKTETQVDPATTISNSIDAGSIATIAVTNGGSDYTSAPAVGFSGGGGTGATATATIVTSSGITGIVQSALGSGYTEDPIIEITGGGGTGATATAHVPLSNGISTIALITAGTGYFNGVIVAFTGGGPGSGAAARATVVSNSPVASIAVTLGGTGYTTATIGITGGGGLGATATVTISAPGVITAITLTNAGYGYESTPTVTITGDGTGATATATVTAGQITGLTITATGIGYTSAPTITIYDALGGAGSGATATAAVLVGVVESYTITNAGSGYTSNPTVQVHAVRAGTNATATASRTVGMVSGINIIAIGSGFTSVPTITFSGGGGTGAAAAATITGTPHSLELVSSSVAQATLTDTVHVIGPNVVSDDLELVDESIPQSRATTQYYLVSAASPIPADSGRVTYERRRFPKNNLLRIEIKKTYAIPPPFSFYDTGSFARPQIFLNFHHAAIGDNECFRQGRSEAVITRVDVSFSLTEHTFSRDSVLYPNGLISHPVNGVDYPLQIDEAQWNQLGFSGHGLTDEDVMLYPIGGGNFAYYHLPASTPTRAQYIALAGLTFVPEIPASSASPGYPATPYTPAKLVPNGQGSWVLTNGESKFWRAKIYRTIKVYTKAL